MAAHAFVVAPPFGVVDATVKYQPYDAKQAALLPIIVMGDQFELALWNAHDLANEEFLAELQRRRISFQSYLQKYRANMLEVIRDLPPRCLVIDGVQLKYVIVAVGGFTEQLEGITGYKPVGRTALQLFHEDVVPRLGLPREDVQET